MAEQLNELAAILNARISITLVRNGIWEPETGVSRPTLEELELLPPPEVPEDPENPDVPTLPEEPDAGTVAPVKKLGFFDKLLKAILDFFRMLFGIKN